MARHEHLPIYKEAYDLALYFETVLSCNAFGGGSAASPGTWMT